MYKLTYTDKNDKLKTVIISSDIQLQKILSNPNNCPQWYSDMNDKRITLHDVMAMKVI